MQIDRIPPDDTGKDGNQHLNEHLNLACLTEKCMQSGRESRAQHLVLTSFDSRNTPPEEMQRQVDDLKIQLLKKEDESRQYMHERDMARDDAQRYRQDLDREKRDSYQYQAERDRAVEEARRCNQYGQSNGLRQYARAGFEEPNARLEELQTSSAKPDQRNMQSEDLHAVLASLDVRNTPPEQLHMVLASWTRTGDLQRQVDDLQAQVQKKDDESRQYMRERDMARDEAQRYRYELESVRNDSYRYQQERDRALNDARRCH